MRLEALSVFICVAECRSIAQAARITHLTQPAVSAILAALEKEVGRVLVERRSRQRSPLRLTASGKIFLEYAYSAQRLEQEMMDSLAVQQRRDHPVILGSGPTSSAVLLPRLLALFRQAHPEVPLQAKTYGSSEQLYQGLLSRDCTLGLASFAPGNNHFLLHELMEDPFVLAAPTPMKLPRTITLRELLSLPLVLREPGCHASHLLSEQLREHGLDIEDLTVAMQVFGNSAVKQGVLMGAGCGFVAASSLLPGDTGCKVIAVEGITLTRRIYLTRRQDCPPTAWQEAFWAMATSAHTKKSLLNQSVHLQNH